MLQAFTGTVTRDIEADDALPLTLQAGDKVYFNQPAPRQLPGYRWADDGGMCSGWVPEAILDPMGRVSIDYCSAQLPAKAGDSMRIMWKGQGFAAVWCEDRHGERGWIPTDALSIPPDQGVEEL